MDGEIMNQASGSMFKKGDMINKLALGTAQFGFDYGIANECGKVAKEEVFRILDYASSYGVDTVDTASVYGDSEDVLGQYLLERCNELKVISKISFKKEDISAKECLMGTLERLSQKKIYGYLAHSFKDIVRQNGLIDEMQSLKSEGLVEKIGISLYGVDELEYLINNSIEIDILQVPYNIMDQRFSKHFPLMKEKGIEIHIRSVFLQGLFFLGIEKFTGDFGPAKNIIEKLRHISFDREIPTQFLCLLFVLMDPYVDKVVIGVDSKEQLKQNIEFSSYIGKVEEIYDELKKLRLDDEKIILPCRWK